MVGRFAEAARVVPPWGWLVGSGYTIAVLALAARGFLAGSTSTIAVAALLSLPASLIAVPGYYLAYGLVALVPGANPDESSGSGRCTTSGDCTYSSTGDPAGWFLITTDVLGVAALCCAALLNLVALWMLTARRTRYRQSAVR